jgi:hypothetical protein
MTVDNLLDNEIPEKFKDAETGELRTDALLQSYRELEKKLSTGKAPPKAPEDYCINCEHGLFTADPDVNKKLHALGLTDEQAQAVYDLAAERLVPMVVQIAGDFQADREVEKLVAHYGGPDKWREISRQLLAFGQKNLPADVVDSLASSFEGVLALQRMMKSEEPGLQKRGAPAEGVSENDLTSMMRDPKYWRDKDPSIVAKVTEGFQRMYGGN